MENGKGRKTCSPCRRRKDSGGDRPGSIDPEADGSQHARSAGFVQRACEDTRGQRNTSGCRFSRAWQRPQAYGGTIQHYLPTYLPVHGGAGDHVGDASLMILSLPRPSKGALPPSPAGILSIPSGQPRTCARQCALPQALERAFTRVPLADT